jgi:hypothetical protein
MDPLLVAGTIRHKQLIRILLPHFPEKLIQTLTVRPGPFGRIRGIRGNDGDSALDQSVDLFHRRRNIHVAVAIVLLYDAYDRKIHRFFDLSDIFHCVGADTYGSPQHGCIRHP